VATSTHPSSSNPGDGNDAIFDFLPEDTVDLRAFEDLTSFEDLQFEDSENGAVLTLDESTSVTFEDLDAEDLNQNQFLLSV
jgi:hypothetical protein